MSEKVSIIIPIYKVEKYLKKCIESVINQTYFNLEIILVDDGSPDKCGKICDEYAKKDSRIKVIHKKNGGLSDARNCGFNVSTGKWIAFIDSDDYIANDYIETLVKLAVEHNAEISIVLPYIVRENTKIKKNRIKAKIETMDNFTAIKTMFYQKKYDTGAWGKLYKKCTMKDIEFPVGKIYEDISTIYKYMLNSKNVVYSNEKKYYYLQRNDSIMGASFKPKDLDYVYQAQNMMDNIIKLNNIELENAAICRFLNTNFSILLKIKRKKSFDEYRQILLKKVKQYRKQVLFDKNARIKTKIAILLSYLGVF